MEFQDNNRIKYLVFRHVKGELTEVEEEELSRWRKARIGNEELFRGVVSRGNLEEGIRRFVKTPKQKEREWDRILNRTVRKGRRSRRLTWMRYAAMFILPLAMGGIIYLLLDREQTIVPAENSIRIIPGESMAELVLPDGKKVMLGRETPGGLGEGVKNNGDTLNYAEVACVSPEIVESYHTLRVPRGGEYTLVLADGTTVYMNAESELKFPRQFKGSDRKVFLTGEAYFDVHRNESQPFLVEVGGVEVRVLGTSFGIRAYPKEENILTTLVSGKVNVSADGMVAELQPGEQADFNKVDKQLTTARVDVNLFVGWKDGRLIFDNAPLEVILAELGRWYSFDVFYTNEELKQIPYSLNVKKDEHLSGVLKLIERTRKVKFEISNQTIIVK